MAVIAPDFELYVAALMLVGCLFTVLRWRRRPPAREQVADAAPIPPRATPRRAAPLLSATTRPQVQ
jgi:hypothetical protein